VTAGSPADARRLDVFKIEMLLRFRGVTSREGVIIHGPAGVGEFSPFWDYGPDESAAWLQAAIEAADLDYPTARRDRIAVNCTVPAVGSDRAASIVAQSHGCRTAKVKVAEPGKPLDEDVERVAAVRSALGTDGRLRVDANGGWSVTQAVEAISALAEYDLEYVEQPCASVEELAELRRLVDVPIAADESIRRAADPLRVRALDAADIAVLKVQPLGGVRACLRIAEQIGLPVVVSSALETSVGIAAGVALAAALPELPYACGLATASMLRNDVTREPFVPVDGFLDVRRPHVDDALVGSASAPRPAQSRWLDRVQECEAVLASRAEWQDRGQ
jgi:O-succinylbenzoate synthase